MGVWRGGARVRHRNGPSRGGRWRGLVFRARVWNCDGEGSKAGEGCRWRGRLFNLIPCELFVGIVNFLKQRLEPESNVCAREADGAAGDVDWFSRQVLHWHKLISLMQISIVNINSNICMVFLQFTFILDV